MCTTAADESKNQTRRDASNQAIFGPQRMGMLANKDSRFLPIVSEQARPNRRLGRPHTAGFHFH